MKEFYQSFGLDREKMHYRGLEKIRELFPDTPVTLLRDVFEKLQLYDLVDLLEKVKPRTLRPAFPMKEMDKLVNARKQRPPKFYRKAEVLIVEYSGRAPLEQEIKQKEEELQRELQGEKDKFQMAVSLVMDKWICQANDEG